MRLSPDNMTCTSIAEDADAFARANYREGQDTSCTFAFDLSKGLQGVSVGMTLYTIYDRRGPKNPKGNNWNAWTKIMYHPEDGYIWQISECGPAGLPGESSRQLKDENGDNVCIPNQAGKPLKITFHHTGRTRSIIQGKGDVSKFGSMTFQILDPERPLEACQATVRTLIDQGHEKDYCQGKINSGPNYGLFYNVHMTGTYTRTGSNFDLVVGKSVQIVDGSKPEMTRRRLKGLKHAHAASKRRQRRL